MLSSGATESVAAIVLLREDGAALLQHRDDKRGLRHAGMWVPPGGHADTGESMLECARRELREETGYEATDLEFLTSFIEAVDGWPPFELTIFWGRYDGMQPVECREGQGLAFVERSRASRYPIPPSLLNAWDAALAAARSIHEQHDS